MAGTKPLTCNGFIESSDFAKSKEELMADTGLTAREIDDRVEALVWALKHGDHEEPEAAVRKVPGRNLWAAILPRGIPPLRIYLRPRADVDGECEWLWIEARL